MKPDQKKLPKYKSRIEAAENYRDSGYRDKWTRFYKRWRNYVDQLRGDDGKPLRGRSNISIPYSYTMLETILPRLVETLFAGRPYVSVKGIPKDNKEYQQYLQMQEKPWDLSASQQEALLDYQMNTSFDIQDKFHIGMKIMGLYGTTVGYTGWKYNERKVIKKEPTPVMMQDANGPVMDETGQPQPLIDQTTGQPVTQLQPFQSNEVQYDDPELKFLDLGLFYVDPNAEDIEDARYCGHKCYETKEYIQKMHDEGIWNVDWKKIPKTPFRNEARNYRMSSIGLPTTDDANLIKEDNELYEIHYYWENDKCVVIINGSWIALDDENPYWHKEKPYVKDVYSKVPGEFYGIGIIEAIEDLQDELNTERNQRIDYRSMRLRRMFKLKRGAKIGPEGWQWKNHGAIELDEFSDLEEFKVEPMAGDSFTQEDIIKRDMQDTTGAQDVVIGTSQATETATTTMSKDNNASMRFKLIISSVEKRLLVRISDMMMQMNQQFISDTRLLDIDGEQGASFVEITPEDIQGRYRLVAMGSSVEPMANKEAHKQRMVELYTTAKDDPFYLQFPIKRRNLMKKVFESFDMKNTDDILPTDQEMQQFEQQQAMMAQQQQEQQAAVDQQTQATEQQKMATDAQFKNADLAIKHQGMQNKAMQAERGLQAVK